MKKEQKKSNLSTREKILLLLPRLSIALVALVLGAVLILWDMGWINLPFLQRTERREPATTATVEETREILVTDWKAFAKSAIGSFYHASLLDDPSSFVSDALFEKKTMSVLKSELKGNFVNVEMGFLKDENGAYYLASDRTKIPDSENYTLLYYRDAQGKGIFQKKDGSGYFTFDSATLTWTSITFDPNAARPASLVPMEKTYGQGQQNTAVFYENGLFGYTGSYRDSRSRKQTFTVPAQYATAFPYSENFAVMADANGKVTIRNERGEAVFSHLNLVLPEKSGTEGLGYSYFDRGLLRVVFATYDSEGKITGTRDGIINTKGEEITLPQGYRAVSYHEGIFTLTDGKNWGYFTSTGAWLTDPVYKHCEPFFEGLAVVTGDGGKVGIIDREGNTILACAFDSIGNFSDGYALLKDQYVGTYLLSKVSGAFPNKNQDLPPEVSSFQTKVTITRGPQNTFVDEEDIVIEFPGISTSSRKPHSEFWETSTTTKAPTTTTQAPPATTTTAPPTTTTQAVGD